MTIDWQLIGVMFVALLVGGLAIYGGVRSGLRGVTTSLERVAGAVEARNAIHAEQVLLMAKKLEAFRTFEVEVTYVKSVDAREASTAYNALCGELRQDTSRFMAVQGGVRIVGTFSGSMRVTVSNAMLREEVSINVWSVIAKKVIEHGFIASYTEIENKK